MNHGEGRSRWSGETTSEMWRKAAKPTNIEFGSVRRHGVPQHRSVYDTSSSSLNTATLSTCAVCGNKSKPRTLSTT
jgi:hypothetical protein